MGFAKDMKAWVEKAKEAMYSKALEITKYTIQMSVQMSPHFESGARWSEGYFVNNWKVGTSTDGVEVLTPIASKEAKISELSSMLSEAMLRGKGGVFVYNNSHYARNVEYLGWAITKEYAPRARALAEIKSKYGGS